jgi:glutamyl-tRNA reductase
MTTDPIEEVDRTTGSGATPPVEQPECQHAEDVVAEMYEDAERIKRGEVEEALDKLHAHGELSDSQREAVERMADAIVDQLLAAPITSSYSADDSAALDTAVRLFDRTDEVDYDELHEDGSYRPEVTSGGN